MPSRMPVIGFIGNFIPPYSTENDRKWSFEKLGYKVIPFQESSTIIGELYDRVSEFDILFYSHTHGWEIQGLKIYFEDLKNLTKKPSVSVHLDRWAWLDRVKDIGKEATWFTEYQFMADFSPEAQKLYKKHNLNAYYLKAGVVERDCYMTPPDPVLFPHDIVFIGSKGYHPEYPFRPHLIDFLAETYGDRFGHYGNDGLGVIRGEDLNILLATAKVVIGDSCFGGRPNYVSDRYYETRGRGGVLIHPKVEGVDYNGVFFYKDGDLKDLKFNIDWLLKNEGAREEARLQGFEHVKNYETYTNRAIEMLNIIWPK